MKTLRLQELNKALGDLPNEAPFLSVMPTLDGTFVLETQGWDKSDELYERTIVAIRTKFVYQTSYMYEGCIKRIEVTGRKETK